jgi:hypothetical protein
MDVAQPTIEPQHLKMAPEQLTIGLERLRSAADQLVGAVS